MNCILYILLALAILLPACRQRTYHQSNADFLKASAEIENSQTAVRFVDVPLSSTRLPTKHPLSEVSVKHKIKKNAAPYSKVESIDIKRQGKKDFQNQDIKKPLDEVPPKFNKDNVFWKIGRTMLRIGGFLFALSGGLMISISSGGGAFLLLGGVLIALAICVLSLPFFLIGIITEIMKRNAKPSLENSDEI